MKDFIKRLNENFDKKRSYLEESISLKSECMKTPEKPFSIWDGDMYDEDEANIDRLFHDADQDELIKMGAFDNLNLEEAVEDIDINYMTISDLLSNMHENVPEEFLDNEIKFFKKLAKVFDTKIYDEIIVAVDDGNYDPKYVFSDGLEMPELGENVTYYPDERMIAENKYGNLYLYFVTEDDCKKYFAMAKKFLTDFDLDSDANIQEKMDKENLKYESLLAEDDTLTEDSISPKEAAKADATRDYENRQPFDNNKWKDEIKLAVMNKYGFSEDEAEMYNMYYWDWYYDVMAAADPDFDDDCDWFEDEE